LNTIHRAACSSLPPANLPEKRQLNGLALELMLAESDALSPDQPSLGSVPCSDKDLMIEF
jgi:hypothetical protein